MKHSPIQRKTWNYRPPISTLCCCFRVCAFIALSLNISYSHANDSSASLQKLFDLPLAQLMEMTVSTASKTEESIAHAPSVVEIVTAKDIHQFGARNLFDVFSRMTSVQVYGSSFAPNNVVSMRGQTFQHHTNHILFLVNGRPFRDSAVGAISASLYQGFPISVIKQIEVIRGPGSVLYGSNAYSGVINIITYEASDDINHEVALSYGSFNTQEISGHSVIRSGDLNLIAGIKAMDRDGWKHEVTDANNVSSHYDTEQEELSTFLNINYKNFALNGYFGHSDQESLGADVLYPTQPFKSKRHFLDLGYTQNLSNNWQAQYNLTYNYMVRNDPFPDQPDIDTSDYLAETNISGDINNELRLMVGASYEEHSGYISQRNVDTTWASAYVQLDYQASDKLKLISGFQLNKPKGVESHSAPRLAAIYSLNSEWTIKGLYGEAFRSPYFLETSFQVPTLIGNPDLKPETITTTELQLFHQTEHAYAGVTLFHSKTEDLITRTGSMPVTFTNSDSISYKGIELETKYHLNQQWTLVSSASYQTNEDDNGGNDTAIAPNTMIKLGLSYQSADERFSASIFNNYFGKPTRTSEVFNNVSVVNPQADDYHLMTAKVSYNLSHLGLKGTSVSLFIDNLLDQDIHYPDINKRLVNSLPIHSGRAAYAKISIHF